jgi:hypothetical protein
MNCSGNLLAQVQETLWHPVFAQFWKGKSGKKEMDAPVEFFDTIGLTFTR